MPTAFTRDPTALIPAFYVGLSQTSVWQMSRGHFSVIWYLAVKFGY